MASALRPRPRKGLSTQLPASFPSATAHVHVYSTTRAVRHRSPQTGENKCAKFRLFFPPLASYSHTFQQSSFHGQCGRELGKRVEAFHFPRRGECEIPLFKSIPARCSKALAVDEVLYCLGWHYFNEVLKFPKRDWKLKENDRLKQGTCDLSALRFVWCSPV